VKLKVTAHWLPWLQMSQWFVSGSSTV